jgi:hypothetical protein
MIKSWRIGLVLVTTLRAASAAPGSSEAAFESFKHLQGKWAIQPEGKALSTAMTYEVGSNGSIVTEQSDKELSVIYRDGASLLMTHFCNTGNGPRLKLNQTGLPETLEFEMFDITNLKSADAPHVQKMIYRIRDDKTIDLEIVWQRGKSQDSEKYTLTRI